MAVWCFSASYRQWSQLEPTKLFNSYPDSVQLSRCRHLALYKGPWASCLALLLNQRSFSWPWAMPESQLGAFQTFQGTSNSTRNLCGVKWITPLCLNDQLNNPPDSRGSITYGLAQHPLTGVQGCLRCRGMSPGLASRPRICALLKQKLQGRGTLWPLTDAAEGIYLIPCISLEAPGTPVSCDKAPPLQCPNLDMNLSLSIS